jgi:glycosyltransferase 2 family protein
VRRVLLRLGQLLLTAVVTLFILERVGVGLDSLRSMDPGSWRPEPLALAAASLVLAGGYLVSALLWGRMVQELGGPRLGVLAAARIYLVSNLGRYVPGKVWALAGMTLLARREGVAAPVAAGAAILGQGVALAGACVVGALAFLEAEGRVRWVGLALLAGVTLALLASAIPPLFGRLVGFAYRLARQIPPTALEADRSFGIRWVALYALNWALYAASFWGLARSLRIDVSLMEAAPAFAAAYVLGFVAVFAPAGIGIREGFLVAFLQPVAGPGALVLAVVSRIWTTAVEVVPAGVLALTAPVTPRPPVNGEEET